MTLASHIKHIMRLLAIKHRGQGSWKLTVPAVQEFSDDSSTARGPGVGAVDLNESGRHHVVVLQFPKHVLTGPHIVVWHVEHMSCREGMSCQMSFMNALYFYLWHYKKHYSTNVYWMVYGVGSPSSWAVVKAEGRPSSSITEQLLLGSHMVPTSAMPRVSQVEAPHRSCVQYFALVNLCGSELEKKPEEHCPERTAIYYNLNLKF